MIKKLSRPDQLGLLVLLTTWLIFFSRTLSTRLIYFLDDLKIIYFPLETVYAGFQQLHQLPLWSRYFGFGHPLLAWGQLGFFNPVHLLLRALSFNPLTLLQFSILFYFAIGSLGMYIFLRQQKLSAPAACLGAFVFTYGGFHIGHLNHVNFYTSSLLLPWLLLILHRLIFTPTLRPALFTAILAAIIALSGQPQIALYTFILAAIWLLFLLPRSPRPTRVILLLLLTALLSFSLAAPAILPLAEFLPLTERADGISRAEILEFSYPPTHAITLLFPYFFGDHHYYWGAKNFQELAAYTGIIPLLLIGFSFGSRRHPLALFGLSTMVVGILFALGQHSPLFLWLVDRGLITSLSIPGRFTLFFIVGISALSSIGLDNWRIFSLRQKTYGLLFSLIFVGFILWPFVSLLFSNKNIYHHFLTITQLTRPEPILILTGIMLFLLTFIFYTRRSGYSSMPWTISGFVALTLIVYGWNYNPLTTTSTAYQTSPLLNTLQSFTQNNASPPRIYRVDHPSVAARRRTEPINPKFTVIQPITASGNSLSCFTVPYQLSDDFLGGSNITISLKRAINGPSLSTFSVNPSTLNGTNMNFCFDPIVTTPGKQYSLHFNSQGDSGFHLIYQPSNLVQQQAYFIRVPEPTQEQLRASQKSVTVLAYPSNNELADLSALRLDRHINASASTSSANWIGALSIKPYRQLVASLLDDDIDPVHYDSQSIINDRRQIMDMVGITHIVEQAIADTDYDYLSSTNFQLVSETVINNFALRLHENTTRFPKTWLIKEAIFSPVDEETINAMRQPDFSPLNYVYINGPTPPQILLSPDPTPLSGQISINRYEDTVIDLSVSSNQPAWLVFSDSTTPAWRTYIDNQPAPYYTAFAVFKAAQVPAGEHTVSFRYESSATNISTHLSAIALLLILTLFGLSSTNPFRDLH